MREPTIRDIEALVGPATPQFAYQLRARIRELIEGLPEDHPVRRYGEEQMELLDRLRHASSEGQDGGHESRSRPRWGKRARSAPADAPLPRPSCAREARAPARGARRGAGRRVRSRRGPDA